MNIFLSPLAASKIEILLDYLEEEWSRKVREDFLTKLTVMFDQISRQPKVVFNLKNSPIYTNVS